MEHRHPRTTPKATWLAVAALTLSCSGAMDWRDTKEMVRERFPEVRQVGVDELARMLDGPEPPLVLDVREPEEAAVSLLPGAVHARGEELERLLRGREPGRLAVLYCSVGYRSSEAVQRLERRGFEDLANLEGSIFEWANSGRPVVRGGERVREVHPYDEEWGRLLERRYWAFEAGE